MKKLLKNKTLFAVMALSLALFSCEHENDTTDMRTVKPVVTANQTIFTLQEGETATITLTTNTPLNREMDFKLELVGGTGSFRDYVSSGDEMAIGDGYGVIGHRIQFPAFATTATFDITPIFDLLPEGTETFEFRFYSMGNAAGLVNANSEKITMTVSNKTSNDFVSVVDWSQTYADAHGTLFAGEYVDNTTNAALHEYCDFDFDLEIYDASFNVVDDSYSDCPEQITLPASTPDGTYYVIPSFWTRTGPAAPKDANKFFKVKVTMAKPGVWMKEVNVDNVWNYALGGVAQGYANGYYPVAELIKTGTTYVLKDMDGNTLASGKLAQLKLKGGRKK